MHGLRWYHIAGAAVAIALAMVFVYAVRSVLPPFLIALAIAWLLDPLLDRLEARGWRRPLAVAGVYFAFLATFVVALVFLVPVVIDQSRQFSQELPGYIHWFQQFATDTMRDNRDLLGRFHLPTTLQEVLTRFGESASHAAAKALQAITSWIASNMSKALWFILVPLIAFYLLNDIDRIRGKALILVPAQWRAKVAEMVHRIGAVFTSYVRGLLVVSLIYGVVTTCVLLAMQLKYAVIIGLIAGVLYAVPYVGAFVTVLMVFLVGLATYGDGAAHAAWAAVAQFMNNQVFDQAVSPRILGKSVGLHPVLSLFALLAGGHLFGLVGMILAVPVAASIQEIVLELYPDLRTAPSYRRKTEDKGGDDHAGEDAKAEAGETPEKDGVGAKT